MEDYKLENYLRILKDCSDRERKREVMDEVVERIFSSFLICEVVSKLQGIRKQECVELKLLKLMASTFKILERNKEVFFLELKRRAKKESLFSPKRK